MSGDYELTRDGYVKIYIDGSCLNNGLNNPTAGVGVWFGDDSCLNVSSPVRGPATNNNAEIQALTVAYRVAAREGFDKIHIYTDSEFTVKAIKEWVHTWKANGWRLVSGEPVKNRRSIEECDSARRKWGGHDRFQLVEAHAGVRGNEEADKLAKAAARRY